MTPARFDVMYAIRTTNAGCPLMSMVAGYTLRQDRLRKILGLSASTVSRMLKRLVQLGWVIKEDRCLEDARTNDIVLTDDGRRAIERAMRIVFRQRTHLKHFEDLFRRGRHHVLVEIALFWEALDMVAVAFGDSSELTYDFGFGYP